MPTTVEPLNTESAPAQDSSTGDLTTRTPAEETDVQPAVSSTATGDQKPKSILEALQRVKPEVAEDAASEDQQDGDSPLNPNAESGEVAAETAEGQQDGQPKANADADGSLNLPYTKDEAWQAVVKNVPADKKSEVIKAIRPVFEKAQRLSAEV